MDLEGHWLRFSSSQGISGLTPVLSTHVFGHGVQSQGQPLLFHQHLLLSQGLLIFEPGDFLNLRVAADDLASHGHMHPLCHDGFLGTDLYVQLWLV